MRLDARRILIALGLSVALFWLGLAGATVFHPDDGSITRSQFLWQIFGIAAYVGIVAFWLSVLAGIVAVVSWIARGRQ